MAKIVRRQLKVGRPKDIKNVIVDKSNPDNYPTLIRFLEATGRIKHTSYVTLMKARNLFLRHVSVDKIAVQLNVEPSIIDRWALCFSWDEERDRRMFEQFRKVSGVNKMYGEDLAKRHDRIAGSIEQTAERLLQRNADGGGTTLSVRDLSGLASTIKATQEIRRTSRGENVKKNENNVSIQIGVPANLERLAGALVDAYDRPKLIQAQTRTIAIGVEDSIGRDTEYEEASNGQAD